MDNSIGGTQDERVCCGRNQCRGGHNIPPDMGELLMIANGHHIKHGVTPNVLIGFLACRDETQPVRVWVGEKEYKVVGGYDFEGIAYLSCEPL